MKIVNILKDLYNLDGYAEIRKAQANGRIIFEDKKVVIEYKEFVDLVVKASIVYAVREAGINPAKTTISCNKHKEHKKELFKYLFYAVFFTWGWMKTKEVLEEETENLAMILVERAENKILDKMYNIQKYKDIEKRYGFVYHTLAHGYIAAKDMGLYNEYRHIARELTEVEKSSLDLMLQYKNVKPSEGTMIDIINQTTELKVIKVEDGYWIE